MAFHLSVLVLPCLFLCTFASEIDDAFKKHKIVPDLIPTAPPSLLGIKYKTERATYDVHLGTYLHPIRVDEPPIEINWKPEPRAYYTLFHLGPNLQGNVPWNTANYVHFCKTNIPGNDWQNAGEEVADYIGARPLEEFGTPYYVYLLYKQPGKIDCEEAKDPADFQKYDFNLKTFLSKHNIKDLVAGNFYTSKYDWDMGWLTSVEPDDFYTYTRPSRPNKKI